MKDFNSAAAGMAAQQQRMDAVANDLANANTTGYKHLRVGFRDLVYDADRPLLGRRACAPAPAPPPSTPAARSRRARCSAPTAARRRDPGRGLPPRPLADGRDALTRDGDLHIDGRRRLTTSTGALVQPAITCPTGVAEDEISIGPDGTVCAAGRRSAASSVVTVRSPRPACCSVGDNAFVTTAASGAADRRAARDHARRRARSSPPTSTWPRRWSR